MKTQIDIEQENLEMMKVIAKKDMDKAINNGTFANLKTTSQIVPWYVGELSNQIELYKAHVLQGKAKVKPIPAKVLLGLDSDTIAHHVLRSVVGGMCRGSSNIIEVASSIAHSLELEYKYGLLSENDAKAHKRLTGFIQSTKYVGSRKLKVADNLINKYHKQVVSGGREVFIRASLKLIVLLSNCRPIINQVIAPPLFDLVNHGNCKETQKLIIVQPWFREWILERINNGELIQSYFTAMIEKPLEWKTLLKKGGFHTKFFQYNIMKTRVDYKHLKGVEASATLNAVNRLQNTKWRINTSILEIMKYSKEHNLGYGKLPKVMDIKPIPFPHPDKNKKDMNEKELKEVKDWKIAITAEYDIKTSEDSRYMSMFRALAEADRFKEYPELFFAYFLDFRGRIYPKASTLHPQGADYIKALLQFSEGKAITNIKAEMFLAMEGANTFGNDKDTFINKHKWVLDNEKDIIKCANDPHNMDTIWHKADKPWGFLSFCIEWRDYKKYGSNFKSRISVAMDGSCNGLQHLSAMLKDEVGGKSVNLTNNSIKGDIYTDVAMKTIDLLIEEDSDLSKKIIKFGINRKTVKRSVMIVPYAGTQRACRTYILEELIDKGGRIYFGDDLGNALNLLVDKVWKAITLRVLKGREIMQFLGKIASNMTKETKNTEIIWTTPNGFRVIQKKVVYKIINIKTPLDEFVKIKRHVSTKIVGETDKTSPREHKTSIAPNFVHSLDACHLQNTVNLMSKGCSFSMIHDSYGVHASDSSELLDNLRIAFYNMYKDGGVLESFIAQQPHIEGQEEIPSYGDLDLADLLESEFFFS